MREISTRRILTSRLSEIFRSVLGLRRSKAHFVIMILAVVGSGVIEYYGTGSLLSSFLVSIGFILFISLLTTVGEAEFGSLDCFDIEHSIAFAIITLPLFSISVVYASDILPTAFFASVLTLTGYLSVKQLLSSNWSLEFEDSKPKD